MYNNLTSVYVIFTEGINMMRLISIQNYYKNVCSLGISNLFVLS